MTEDRRRLGSPIEHTCTGADGEAKEKHKETWLFLLGLCQDNRISGLLLAHTCKASSKNFDKQPTRAVDHEVVFQLSALLEWALLGFTPN